MLAAKVMWRAAFIMIFAMSFVPAGDLCGKLLTGTYDVSPRFVAWSRFFIGTLLLVPFLSRSALPLLVDWRIWLRGSLIACGVLLIQQALKTEPLANVFAAFFIAPLLSYILSIRLLGETVTPLRSLALLLGFLGVLLVVRPGFGGTPGLFWALLAGFFYAFVLVTGRWLADYARPGESLFAQFLVASIVLSPLGLTAIPPLTTEIAGLAIGSALGSTLGNFLLIVASGLTTATRLAPMVYIQLVAATALGWLVFRDLPDAYAWAGIALILTAGIGSTLLRR